MILLTTLLYYVLFFWGFFIMIFIQGAHISEELCSLLLSTPSIPMDPVATLDIPLKHTDRAAQGIPI